MTVKEWTVELPRRITNMLIASFLLAIFLPLMILIVIRIKIEDPSSPILFKQVRIGRDRRRFGTPNTDEPFHGKRKVNLGGQPFVMYKFRTMVHDPHRRVGRAVDHDMYITRFGKFLRAHRLDELPQLFNVLLGDMNIVGPRPEQPKLVEDLQKSIVGYQIRHFVHPGITGLAQINLAYDQSLSDVDRKIAMDLKYVETRSVWLDLWIMLMTPYVMVTRKGSM